MKRYTAFALAAAFIAAVLTPNLPLSDFTIYWKAAETLINGGNPYDLPHQGYYNTGTVLPLEAQLKMTPHFQVYGPPAVLGIVLPFGVLSQQHAKKLFLFGLYLTVLLSVRRAGVLLPLLPIGVAYLEFLWGGPAWIALLGILLSVQLYGRNLKRSSGFALALLGIKIHLFSLVILYVVLRAFSKREYHLVCGLAAGYALLSIIPMFFQTSLYAMYSSLITSEQPLNYFNATLPSLLVSGLGLPTYFLFMPLLIVIALMLFYWRHISSLEYDSGILLILPISLFLAPYAWIHDYIVLIPTTLLLCEYYRNLKNRVLALSLGIILLFVSVLDKFFGVWKDYYTIDWYLFFGSGYAIAAALVLSRPRERRG